jgi:hypothetical protein
MIDEHLKKAKDLLSREEDDALVYACLELRMAIECHVYNKLKHYSKRHGKKLLYKQWQPNKAIKTLCQLEPNSDLSYTLSIGTQESSGEPAKEMHQLGRHEALPKSWINKNYHKLGSYLHLQMDASNSKSAAREYLDKIVKELERVERGNLISDFAEISTINCRLCGNPVVSNTSALPDLDEVVCPNPACRATYSVENSDGKWLCNLIALFHKCSQCDAETAILKSDLAIGFCFQCDNCKSKYEIVNQQWGIKLTGS